MLLFYIRSFICLEQWSPEVDDFFFFRGGFMVILFPRSLSNRLFEEIFVLSVLFVSFETVDCCGLSTVVVVFLELFAVFISV